MLYALDNLFKLLSRFTDNPSGSGLNVELSLTK